MLWTNLSIFLLSLLSLFLLYQLYSASGPSQKQHSSFKHNQNIPKKEENNFLNTMDSVNFEDSQKPEQQPPGEDAEEELETYLQTHKDLLKKETHDKELNFMVLGDFGYVDKDKPDPEQERLGALIFNKVKKTFVNYDFLVSVGDNFYPYGLDSHDDPKADILFEETFQMSSLNLDWYPVMGNHDLLGDMSAALRLHERFPLWKQKDPYYSRTFNIGNSHLQAGFIFLHSCDLVCEKKTNPECYRGTQKNVKFDQIQTQIDWMDDVLDMWSNDPTIIWKIVVIHNAIFSAGERHGDNEDLKKSILPLLSKYKVDIVLSGHDHSVKYLRMDLEEEVADNSEDTSCTKYLDPTYCNEKEFFYFELTDCGKIKSAQQNNGFKTFYQLTGKKFLGSLDEKYTRESIVSQHQYLHQFVLGNGGLKHEKMCPVKQMESQGKLRYGHSVSGIGDIKIKEDRMEVNLVSVDNEILYSIKIFK